MDFCQQSMCALLRLFVVLLCLQSGRPAVAEIYRWVDENGTVNFGDRKPAQVEKRSIVVNLKNATTNKQRLATLEKEVGKIVLKRVAHGQYQQYIPEGGLDSFKIVVVNHGMFSKNETAIISAKNTLDDWIPFANKHKAIIIAPVFDNHNYATTVLGARNGGYRGLYGRHVGADDFLHEIIYKYQMASNSYDGRFYLSGHSAGAQFANRYLVRHPERVIAAAFSAPAWFAQPAKQHKWPYGMGNRKFTAQWPGEHFARKINMQPDPNGWLLATQRPIAVVVGELDLKKIRHVNGIGGDTHVTRAKHWVTAMNEYAGQFGRRGSVELILKPNVGHNYGKLARLCQAFLTKHMRTEG